ncbi:hypothetical protein INT47_002923 [Mucor saturninus]|uniref:Uncharacterized protein n=1 Tax=Mucor saturninus TaxID=64648 RepID=A0A8H7QPG7_9FUNG|nr:hypothetical protein INT47_002923 [Mucor saturninus]
MQIQEEKKGDSKEKDVGDEYIYEEDSDGCIYEEDDGDNDNIPSDLTIDHHPGRECQYIFDHERVSEEASDHEEIAEEDEWVVGDLCVSEKCRLLKDNTLKLKKYPGSLSDIRLLAISDIFIFDKDINMSASKYFGLEDHKTIISSLDTTKYRPKIGIRAHQWC